jgi:hypothetical protein
MRPPRPLAPTAAALLAALLAAAGGHSQLEPSGAGQPIAERAPVAIAAGATLRTRPTTAAPVVTIVEEATLGELVEERSGWRRVRIGPTTGWLAPAGLAGDAAAPEVDRARLSAALALVPAPRIETTVLGVTLYATGDEEARLERWAKVAGQTLASWPGRLGVAAAALDGAAVAFAPGEEPADAATGAPASSGGGVVLVRTGARSDDELEALLVHELSHLASERAFPRPLPIWLEEGIAEWLAREPLGSDGNSIQGTLRGDVEVAAEGRGRRVDFTGPLADLARLARAAKAGTLPALDAWTALPAAAFSAAGAREENYALAGSFVRFLFEADEARAALVRAALAAAAEAGADLDAELASGLGDLAELERDFRDWLVAELDRQVLPEIP